MREIGRLPRRVTGRQALERRLRSMLIAVARFSEHRANSSPTDKLWGARVIDALREALVDREQHFSE